MVKSNLEATAKKINRREALLNIRGKKAVICHTRREEFYEISTIEELEEVVNYEQRGMYDHLHFYEKKLNMEK